MERKTKINAEDGKQELMITREFDLPVGITFSEHIQIPKLLNNGWEQKC